MLLRLNKEQTRIVMDILRGNKSQEEPRIKNRRRGTSRSSLNYTRVKNPRQNIL